MATYTKALTTATITMNDGAQFVVEDTLECSLASAALASLESGRSATVTVDGTEYKIFASGVSYIKVEKEQSEQIPVPEPSC